MNLIIHTNEFGFGSEFVVFETLFQINLLDEWMV